MNAILKRVLSTKVESYWIGKNQLTEQPSYKRNFVEKPHDETE